MDFEHKKLNFGIQHPYKHKKQQITRNLSMGYLACAGKQQVDMWHSTLKEWQAKCRKERWMNQRACPGKSYEPTNLEHFANTLSHGAMIIPSILAGELLLHSVEYRLYDAGDDFGDNGTSTNADDPTHLHYEVSARIYGGCLVGLFLVSSVFHWLTWSKCDHPTKTVGLSDSCFRSSLWEFFHICDRAIIFTFIAGSYTPWFMLSAVDPSVSWLGWGMWLFVGMGTLYSSMFLEKYKLLETLMYVAQGVLPALALSYTAHTSAMQSMSYGGFFYLFGVFLFKSDGWIPCAHAIWHLFVVAGYHLYKMLGRVRSGLQSALSNKHLRQGVPFLTFILLGWMGIREFAQIRYDMKKKLGLASEFQDRMEKAGLEKTEQLSVEKEYQKMVEENDTDSWFNIRGPRPEEDSKTIQMKIREQHAEIAQTK